MKYNLLKVISEKLLEAVSIANVELIDSLSKAYQRVSSSIEQGKGNT